MLSIYHICNCHHFVTGVSEVIWYLCITYWMVNLMLINLFFFSEIFYLATRGHNFKLNKQHFHKNVRPHALSLRGIIYWNSLANYIANTNSLSSFKQLLDDHWTNYHCNLYICEQDSQAVPFPTINHKWQWWREKNKKGCGKEGNHGR